MRRLPFLLAAAAAAGCVTTSTFQAQQKAARDAQAMAVRLNDQLNAANARVAGLTKDLAASQAEGEGLAKDKAALQSRLAETSSKLASSTEQVASLERSGADLRQALESSRSALTRKVGELVKEKDAVAQRLASTEKSAAEAKAAADQNAAGLAAANDGLKGRVGDLTTELDGLRKAKAALEQEKAALQKQKDDELTAAKKSYDEMAAGLQAEIKSGELTISNLKGRLTVNMVDKILFGSGSAEVTADGRKVLAHVGEILNQVGDKDIRIEGHTDDRPISAELRARYPSNWELSTARATAVARYLQDHAKVDPARLVAAGMGQWRPVAPNDTPEHRALNRRIDIILVPRE